jgi:hypothetical protein
LHPPDGEFFKVLIDRHAQIEELLIAPGDRNRWNKLNWVQLGSTILNDFSTILNDITQISAPCAQVNGDNLGLKIKSHRFL